MTYVFDIDDTIFFSSIDGHGEYQIDSVNEELIERINALFNSGNTIIIFTGRHWRHLELTKKQLMNCNVKYDALILGKPIADVYIDDRAMAPRDFLKGVKTDG